MIGGGTLIGLSNLMTGVTNFNEIIELASRGDHTKVDMMVRDIYGDHSPIVELHGDLLASSFAKIANDQSDENLRTKYAKEDILASLVTMISYNVGQLAYFQAHLHKCP